MKTLFLKLLLIAFTTFQSHAQKGQPAFGKVDKADLLMTDCEFDKGADAMKLIDWGNSYYDRGTVGYSTFKTVFQRRIRIKILKEKGIDEANVEIPFYTHNNEERVLKLSANTYNLDAAGKIQTSEVKKSSIYAKKINSYYSKMIIAFPEVKVGSIIEYMYTLERETLSMNDWYFQSHIPVRYSEYQLKIPQLFRFSVQPMIVDPVEDKQEIVKEIISMDEGALETPCLKSNYIMRNLPGIRNEPFMGSAKDYMQRIEFQLTQIYYNDNHVQDISLKWKDVIKNNLRQHESFGLQLGKTVTAAAALVVDAKKIENPEQRMKFLFNEVRNHLTWTKSFDIYTDNSLNKTWELKTGNTADINLLLVNLLNESGVKSTPILFSTRQHGLVAPTYPFINQFNTVMAYVELKDRYFVLDASDKVSHYKLMPKDIVNTKGFIPEGEHGRWKDILSGKSKYKVMAAVQGEIDADGVLKGKGLVNCYEYARVKRCARFNDDKEQFKADYFVKNYPGLNIEKIMINNLEYDSLPLEQEIKFNAVLNSSGEYRYFPVNLFSELEENPFIAGTRISDVDFGVHRDFTIFGNYTIPPDFVFEGVPENLSIATSDNGIIFNRFTQVENNLLNVRMTLEFKRTFYPAGSYEEFRTFYKKLFDKLNEQVVIKKKATP